MTITLLGNTKSCILYSLNRLMMDLIAMDGVPNDHYEFGVHIVVKEEPRHSYIEEVLHFQQNVNLDYDRFKCERAIKQELDEFENVLPKKDNDLPQLHLVTEVIVKKEEEDLDYQFLNCLQDFKNKNLRIVLKRFKCFICAHCSLFYKSKRNLVQHVHSRHFLLFQNDHNTSKTLISCKICNKELPYKSWHEHMTIVHSVDKYPCNLCHKTFKHKRYFKKHVKHVHENCKPAYKLPGSPVECPTCSKMFMNKHALHTHIKTCHSGQSYTCKVCNSTLKCKTYLNAHMRRVHYNDGKMHVCDICTKNFKSPRYLKIHRKNSHYSL